MTEVINFVSHYQAKKPDASGFIEYTPEEHEVWRYLYERQIKLLPGHACQEHIQGLKNLGLTPDAIPQLPKVTTRLYAKTGWSLSPVESLISAEAFFNLLANQHFPVATFIRTQEEIDYVKEPDLFHELFGHCPMITHPVFADFMQKYAQLVLNMNQTDWPLLQRLFWFTVEFGLIQPPDQGLRAYGGGILSSFTETRYAVESDQPQRKPFDILDILRTPYRIDQLQPIYFLIKDYADLYQLTGSLEALTSCLKQARLRGEHSPCFQVDFNNPNIHIFAC